MNRTQLILTTIIICLLLIGVTLLVTSMNNYQEPVLPTKNVTNNNTTAINATLDNASNENDGNNGESTQYSSSGSSSSSSSSSSSDSSSSSSSSSGQVESRELKYNHQLDDGSYYYEVTYSDGHFDQYDAETGAQIGHG